MIISKTFDFHGNPILLEHPVEVTELSENVKMKAFDYDGELKAIFEGDTPAVLNINYVRTFHNGKIKNFSEIVHVDEDHRVISLSSAPWGLLNGDYVVSVSIAVTYGQEGINGYNKG